jgi:hypothetical protein
MKYVFVTVALLLAASCTKKGCTDPTALNYNQEAQQDDGTCNYNSQDNLLVGEINSDKTLTADRVWTLKGRVTVTPGNTLTIQPGTIIKAEAGTGANASCLLVARGAKIYAQGTSINPIIFTSTADDIQLGQRVGSSLNSGISGLWGGLIICGNAPISADAVSVQIEGIPASDNNGLYGGTDETDNSGIVNYVSIRHGGANIGEGNEINGLTLGGVGSETVINNIEIVANQDDGIECFGGTVNVSNLLVWNAGDDAIDIDQAYSGTIDHVIVIVGQTTDHALEFDGGEGTWNAAFTVTNCEVIADLAQAHFRAGAEGYVSLYGNVNVESDAGTAVVVDTLPVGLEYSTFNWMYYFN